eukprot:620389-Hanusia_phi.AAC.1
MIRMLSTRPFNDSLKTSLKTSLRTDPTSSRYTSRLLPCNGTLSAVPKVFVKRTVSPPVTRETWASSHHRSFSDIRVYLECSRPRGLPGGEVQREGGEVCSTERRADGESRDPDGRAMEEELGNPGDT